ncbi:hypothetical protein HCH52_02240 [Oscillospiraceae bacterium HV4-5-C5C]|nr:hypothetical protein [Oscillospiraceae bacterium HV4-5-C5C]
MVPIWLDWFYPIFIVVCEAPAASSDDQLILYYNHNRSILIPETGIGRRLKDSHQQVAITPVSLKATA